MDTRRELESLTRDLRGHLEWLRENGVRFVAGSTPRSHVESPSAPSAEAPSTVSLKTAFQAAIAAERAAASKVPVSPKTPVVSTPLRTLETVRAELGECQRCKLGKTRTKLVFGDGGPQARLVFVGEAPGSEEDLQGIPFVGAAGQLLTKMIQAMGLERSEVYICNVCKCRPPGNRNPEPDEIAACEGVLKAQLEAIRPKVIVALGKFAAQTLLQDTTPITRLRGQFKSYCGIPLMPTFHPAYLLRDPSQKRLAWEDLQKVMALLKAP